MMATKILEERQISSNRRLESLRADLKQTELQISGKACVYATGSFGRGEAGDYSDLDLFISGKNARKKNSDGSKPNLLKRLEEICLKSDLIRETRRHNFPDFSGDGRWLLNHSVNALTKTLGHPEDDLENTFTARLLLLLESDCLLESRVYDEIINKVIQAYWRDYDNHRHEFVPAFLANDILRLWRTFCVNYEARTKNVPDEERAKRKIKNYKLKHSRMLTCYSALLFLLYTYGQKGTVTPADARSMVRLTPTKRLIWLADQPNIDPAVINEIASLLSRYEQFLDDTNASEERLVDLFLDNAVARERMTRAGTFGDMMAEVLMEMGQKGKAKDFFRLILV